MGGMGIFREARPYLGEIPATLTWLEIHAFSTERSAAHCSRIMQNKWRNVENAALTRVKGTRGGSVEMRTLPDKKSMKTHELWRQILSAAVLSGFWMEIAICEWRPIGCTLSESNPIFHYSWCEQVEQKRWLVCLNDTPHSSRGSYSKRPALLSDIKH